MRAAPLLTLLALALTAPTAAAQAPQSFSLPIDCRVGEVCVVQNYVDADPSSSTRDAWCGPLSYNAHDGLDFRAPQALAQRGVRVLAPAAGVVAALRDGEPERAFLNGGSAAVANKECGNGVLLDHGGGLATQLCHMRAGAFMVQRGQRVEAGHALGLVGLSGQTEFPHVHMTLRRNNAAIDPYAGASMPRSCSAEGVRPGAHWTQAARAQLAYRGSLWFAAGFTGAPPPSDARAEELPANAAARAPALVFWALASGPRGGDVLRARLYGPSGALIAEGTRAQPRDQAQAWLFAGRRTPDGGWTAGRYRGEARLERAGRVIQTKTAEITLAR